MTDWRSRLLLAGRYAIGLVALAWLVSQTDWSRMAATAGSLDPVVAVAILAVSVVGLAARFGTWHLLLARLGATPVHVAAKTTLSIAFVNHLSPTQAVGRSLAPAILRQFTGYRWGELMAVAAAHTALFAGLYGLATITGLLAFWQAFPVWLTLALGAAAGTYLLVAVTIVATGTRLDRVGALATGVSRRLPTARLPLLETAIDRFHAAVPTVGADAAETLADVLTRKRTVAGYVLAWATGVMLVPGVRSWLLLSAAGVSFEPAVVLPLALVTAYAVTLVPVTPGGVGVAEASGTLVLGALGVPASVAAPIVLVDRFLGAYLPALLGWVPTMRLEFPARSDSCDEND